MALKLQNYASKCLPDGLVARSGAFRLQIAALSSLDGYNHVARLQRCKFLKTRRFHANSRLVSGQIDSYHIDSHYEFLT